MKNFLLCALLSLCSVPAFAVNCDSNVVDNANILQGVTTNPLSSLGADPHIITDTSYTGTPENLVQQYYHSCRNWQAAGGGVKSNLVVFVLFVKSSVHQKGQIGLFSGQAWEHALDSNLVRSQMVPFFKDGNYSQGIQTGINGAANAIFAYQHPKQTVVNETPTDFSGLWTVLKWGLLFGVLGGLGWLLWVIYRHRKEHREECQAAQKDAVLARNEAADYVNSHPDDGNVAEKFSRLSNSESMNPDGDWEAEEYRVIAAAYRALIKYKTTTYKEPIPFPSSGGEILRAETPTKQAEPTSNTTVINKTYVDTYTPNPFIPVPIVIEEPEPVIVRESSWGHSWGTGSRDRDDDSSSKDSGWSNSSSSSSFDSGSSSSWSDNSSSSSFDSGSGDSGGGFSGGDSSF